jgi:mannose-1-phosphate guanylyltransferase
MQITPVILCGGSGTRLWPLSRASYPKQFAPFLGAQSLFQEAALRLTGPGFAPPLVVTSGEFRFLATGQLAEVGIDPGAVLLEPEGRNTAPAVLAAALHAARQAPETLLLVCPSDHAIADPGGFRAAVQAGAEAAAAGRIVTFGLAPDRPETGYGYLELAAAPEPGPPAPRPLVRFVEKPDAARAAAMLAGGRHLCRRRSLPPSSGSSRRCWRRCRTRSPAPDPISASCASTRRRGPGPRRSRSTTR